MERGRNMTADRGAEKKTKEEERRGQTWKESNEEERGVKRQ